MRRTTVAVLVMVVGIAFIVTPFVTRLFSRSEAFDAMTGGFRPIMTAQAAQQFKADLAGLEAAGTEFSTKAAPALAASLKMTPAQFQAFMATSFPAVTGGMKALPQMLPSLKGVLGSLESERGRFASADAIPTSSQPPTTVPWGILIGGFAALAFGAMILRAPRRGAALVVLVGVLFVGVTFGLSMPSKTADTDTMNAHLKPMYTATTVAGAKQSLAALQAMGTEMQSKMFPALAQRFQLQPAEMQAFMSQNFPALSATLTGFPAAMARFQTLVTIFDTQLANYNAIKPLALVPVAWWMIGGGAFIALLGLIAFPSAERAEVRTYPRRVTDVSERKAAGS